jgi:glycosyltransferase involved in cell wall biosynthesis
MPKVAVVIPCYKVKNHILNVINKIDDIASKVYVVDDCCPEGSGSYVQENSKDKRVQILFNSVNKGVGGATKTGYIQALSDGMDIVVKLDGDGQMDPGLISDLIDPIQKKRADYVKGNRFYQLKFLKSMPKIRLLGNSMLSLINKFSSGYWNIMDPTNGFTAIHRNALYLLDLEKIDNRYFFESDMLFRLNTIRATVEDFPMSAKYEDEQSSMNIKRIILSFPGKYLNRFFKRIFYNYFLRDFNFGTLSLISGCFLLIFGFTFGLYNWISNADKQIFTPTGTITFSSVSVILGAQFLMNFWNFDISNVPKIPLVDRLKL